MGQADFLEFLDFTPSQKEIAFAIAGSEKELKELEQLLKDDKFYQAKNPPFQREVQQ
jgi:hypothetical protein